MTYQEFVAEPKILMRRIKHMIEDVALKREACMNTTIDFKERVQTSPINSTEISYSRYIDAYNKLNKMMDELEEKQKKVRSFFQESLNPEEADLLEWRYVDCKSTEEIARLNSIALQTAKNKLSKADKKARRAWSEKQA